MSLLELKDMVFEVEHKKILDGFSMTIEASEVPALLGTNGTGKSTLAYLIMGREGYRPSSGETRAKKSFEDPPQQATGNLNAMNFLFLYSLA